MDQLSIEKWSDLNRVNNLLPEHIIEKLTLLKNMNMVKALEIAKQGTIAWLLENIGLSFIYIEPSGSFWGAQKIAFDKPPTKEILPFEGTAARYYRENGYRMFLIDQEGRRIPITNRKSKAIKYPLRQWNKNIPLEALKMLPSSMVNKAVIFDIVNNPDPILAYPIKRNTFVNIKYHAKEKTRGFLGIISENDRVVNNWFMPNDDLFYGGIYAWDK